MTQAIDPAKLKEAAEHLEWVLQQYPDSEDVRDLLQSLSPLIDDARAQRISAPLDGTRIPGAYNFGDGRYVPYGDPSVDEAYTSFIIELEGGLTERDRLRIARLDPMRRVMLDSGPTTIN